MAEQMSTQVASEVGDGDCHSEAAMIIENEASAQAALASNSNKTRKNTSFKITNILPSRPPSNDPDESGDDDPDDSHTEDISEHFDHVLNAPNVTARGRFNILPCPQDEMSAISPLSTLSNVVSATTSSSTVGGAPPSSSRTTALAEDQK